MTNICFGCGQYQVDKEIINQGEKNFAKCKTCGVMNPYLSLPLFIISGASGVGKTSILNNLKERLKDFVFLDADNLVIENDFSDKSKENLLSIMYPKFRTTFQ